MSEETTTSRTDSTFSFPVDPEPVSMRLTLMFLFLVFVAITYVIVDLIIPGAGINFIAFAIALLVGGFAMQMSETYLKKQWKPTRFIDVTPEKLSLRKKTRLQSELDPAQPVNVLTWNFKINRRTHVPKGWHVMALALEQNGAYMPVYTLVSPDDFPQMNSSGLFVTLEKTKTDDDDKRVDMRAAGVQRRLHAAEGARVYEGAEMTQESFRAYVNRLEVMFPEWMPKTHL